MKNITIAANVTYSGAQFNTKLFIEYKHTGVYYFVKTSKGIHILSGIDSAKEKQAKGKNVFISSGYYFIDRLAIPTSNNNKWYINNDGDTYMVNKVSKYGKKIHSELSKENIRKFN
jgi:hypothetical protein